MPKYYVVVIRTATADTQHMKSLLAVKSQSGAVVDSHEITSKSRGPSAVILHHEIPVVGKEAAYNGLLRPSQSTGTLKAYGALELWSHEKEAQDWIDTTDGIEFCKNATDIFIVSTRV